MSMGRHVLRVQSLPKETSAVNNIASSNNAGFGAACIIVRAVSGVADVGILHLPLPLHPLPYPRSGLAGHVLGDDTVEY